MGQMPTARSTWVDRPVRFCVLCPRRPRALQPQLVHRHSMRLKGVDLNDLCTLGISHIIAMAVGFLPLVRKLHDLVGAQNAALLENLGARLAHSWRSNRLLRRL